MVDDFYTEAEQWERVKQWVRENGLWLLGGVLIGVGGLAGWRWWQERIETQALNASTRYGQVIEALGRGDRTRAFTLIDELHADFGSSPYADQADLAAARVFVETKELQKAAERLSAVMTNSKDPELRLVARLRLARVQLAQGNIDSSLATLNGAPAGAFEPRFEEVRGDALYTRGDMNGALAAYRKARAADQGNVLDSAAIDLKIADLVADGHGAAAAPIPKPASSPPAGKP